jgi:hypothetical protein
MMQILCLLGMLLRLRALLYIHTSSQHTSLTL